MATGQKCQIFKIIDRRLSDEGGNPHQERIETLEEALTHAKTLGLSDQISIFQRELDTLLSHNAIFTDSLTGAQVTIWRHWLPFQWTQSSSGDQCPIKNYPWPIPTLALQCWAKHKNNDRFQNYEIWAADSQIRNEAALVGRRGNAYYLLAHWGDTPELRLPSFGTIKQNLVENWEKDIRNRSKNERLAVQFVWHLILFAVTTTIIALFLTSKYQVDPHLSIVPSALPAVIISKLSYEIISSKRIKKWKKEDTLMQAIETDTALNNDDPTDISHGFHV